MAEEVKEEELEQEVQEETVAEEISKEQELEEKLKEQTDKYMRLYAEYDNFRKRSQREKDARYADALIDAVAELLPIGDNLERALQTEVTSEEAIKLKEGVEMVKKQFDEALAKLDVAPIEAVGNEFDPNLHNAVMHIEDEELGENVVAEEFQKGYMYRDSVVRYSMVKVAN